MKIYLASTAPGHEGKEPKLSLKNIHRRLLSYHHILFKMFTSQVVFESIIKEKTDGSQPNKVSKKS